MKILKPSRQSEYPTDFLIAHLKGRKGRLQIDWNSFAAAEDPAAWVHPPWLAPFLRLRQADGPWLFLVDEYSWVRRRMNSRLRRVFFPVFLYFELPNLLSMLRCKAYGNRMDRIDTLCSRSLLDPSVFRLFRTRPSVEEILQQLEQRLSTISGRFSTLRQPYAQGGFQALDHALFAAFFAYCRSLPLPGVVTGFIRGLVDATNLLGLYKAGQWGGGAAPALIPGGTIPERVLHQALEKNTVEVILKRAGVADRSLAVRSGVAMESALYVQLRKVLRRNMHDPAGYGYVLFHLWGLYLFARRYSLFLSGSRFHDHHLQATGLA
jgi:vacuolar-type H+-ATPase subunit C/Vma6